MLPSCYCLPVSSPWLPAHTYFNVDRASPNCVMCCYAVCAVATAMQAVINTAVILDGKLSTPADCDYKWLGVENSLEVVNEPDLNYRAKVVMPAVAGTYKFQMTMNCPNAQSLCPVTVVTVSESECTYSLRWSCKNIIGAANYTVCSLLVKRVLLCVAMLS